MNVRRTTMAVGIALTAVLFFSLPVESMYDEDCLSKEDPYSPLRLSSVEVERKKVQKNGTSHIRNEDRETFTDAEKLEAVTYMAGFLATSLVLIKEENKEHNYLLPMHCLKKKRLECTIMPV